MMETIHNIEQYDRQTAKLEFAARLRGDSMAEVAELVGARETERQRLVALLEGRADADVS
jgi:hypothetical protein